MGTEEHAQRATAPSHRRALRQAPAPPLSSLRSLSFPPRKGMLLVDGVAAGNVAVTELELRQLGQRRHLRRQVAAQLVVVELEDAQPRAFGEISGHLAHQLIVLQIEPFEAQAAAKGGGDAAFELVAVESEADEHDARAEGLRDAASQSSTREHEHTQPRARQPALQFHVRRPQQQRAECPPAQPVVLSRRSVTWSGELELYEEARIGLQQRSETRGIVVADRRVVAVKLTVESCGIFNWD